MSPDAILEELAQTEAAIREEKQMMREKRLSYEKKNWENSQPPPRTRQISHTR